jgi:hypothetical protein
VLKYRPDSLNEILGTGGCGARHLEDVTRQHQTADVGAEERGAQLALVAGQDVAERREYERAEVIAQHPAGVVVGQACPEYGQHPLADLRAILPQADNPSYELFSGPAWFVGDPGEHGGRIHRRLERSRKEPVLVAEVVIDERRVHVGSGAHRAHGGALEAEFREQFLGGVQYRLPGVRAAQRASTSRGH